MIQYHQGIGAGGMLTLSHDNIWFSVLGDLQQVLDTQSQSRVTEFLGCPILPPLRGRVKRKHHVSSCNSRLR
jgi:hypothetical protein